MLFKQIIEHDYLAVYFYKDDDDESDEILQHLELIDDGTAVFPEVSLMDRIVSLTLTFVCVPQIARSSRYTWSKSTTT